MDPSIKNMLLSSGSSVVEHKTGKRKSHLIHATASSTVRLDIYIIGESVEECDYVQLWELTQLSILDTLQIFMTDVSRVSFALDFHGDAAINSSWFNLVMRPTSALLSSRKDVFEQASWFDV